MPASLTTNSDVLELLQRFDNPAVRVTDVILLPEIEDPEGNGYADSYWLRFESSAGEVEGKLHLPRENVGKIIIFEPGFPGNGSTRFEQLHLRQVLQAGYAVFTARHNGTIIDGKYSDNYLDCQKKKEKAKQENQEVLGRNYPHTLADWLREPLVSVQALSLAFSDEIYLIGHSFGALAIHYSLYDLEEYIGGELNKVKRIVSLSGTVGRLREIDDPILLQWREHLDTDWTRQRVRIGNVSRNIEVLRQAYTRIHEAASKFPESIDAVYITPHGDKKENLDELVSPLEAIDMIATLRRGSLVIDRTQSADDSTGRMVHDMDSLKTPVLLDCLQGNLPKQNSITVISK